METLQVRIIAVSGAQADPQGKDHRSHCTWPTRTSSSMAKLISLLTEQLSVQTMQHVTKKKNGLPNPTENQIQEKTQIWQSQYSV